MANGNINPFKETDEQQKNNNNNDILQENAQFDYNLLSDKAVGEQIKYVRENLDNKEIIIEKAELTLATKKSEIITALNDKNKKYCKVPFVVTYNLKNQDGMNHREYLSGAIQFLQGNDTLSMPSFWYQGSSNQVAELWEKVATFKKLKPDELSPREFLGFLNSKPKARLEYKMTTSNKKEYQVKKNFIKEFI